MKLLKRCLCIIAATAVFILSLPITSFAQDDAHRTVRVGYYKLNNYQMQDESGRRSGYCYDYLQNLRLYTNWRYQYIGYGKSWSDMLGLLKRGEIDLLTTAANYSYGSEFVRSERPVCNTSVVLITTADKEETVREKIKSGSISVGFVSGRSEKENFSVYANDNGITYKQTFFGTVDGLRDAIAANTVDAGVTTGISVPQDCVTVMQIDTQPLYLLTRATDTELLKEANYALEQLSVNKSTLSERLYAQYYAGAGDDSTAFSEAELKYIDENVSSGRVFNVLVRGYTEPYSYYDGTELRGIVCDSCRLVLGQTGLTTKIVAAGSNEVYDSLLQSGDIDICLDMPYDYNYAEKRGFRLTEPYIITNYARLFRKDHKGDISTIALLSADIDITAYAPETDDKGFIYYDTVEECVNAVKNGVCDAAYLLNGIAQKAVYDDVTNSLSVLTLSGSAISISIAVNDSDGELLTSIVNKCVLRTDEKGITDISNNYLDIHDLDESLVFLLYSEPIMFIIGSIALCVFIIAVIIIITGIKHRRSECARIFEFERFISFVCSAYDDVSEYDMKNHRKIRYSLKKGQIERDVKKIDGDAIESLYDSVMPEDKDTVRKKWNSILEAETDAGHTEYMEFRFKRESGQISWISCLIMRIAKDNLHPYNFMIFTRCIDSEKEEREQQRSYLADALVAAKQASVAKSSFLSRMSHEIRTPLNAIMGYNTISRGILASGTLDEDNAGEIDSCLEKADDAGRHLLSIINDVLDISSIESGRMQISNERFDFHGLLLTVADMFQTQATVKDVNFFANLNGIISNSLIGDSLRLKQILINLLSNAVKFTPKGGIVRFTVAEKEHKGDTVIMSFSVKDTGIGIKPEALSKIFEPFEQENVSIVQKYGGTGLGLSITKNLVSMMQGDIFVESEPEHGSTFTVNLPFELATHAEESADEAQVVYDFSGKRLLIAEDNAMNLEIATRLLRDVGFTVDTANDGNEAVERFKSSEVNAYSLILMDIQMPELDGYEATREIRAIRRRDAQTVPIIAMTANAFTEDVAKALAAGMDAHIAKPLDRELMLRIISEHI